MAEEKFNIEVAVKAQLEELKKVESALGEINYKVKEYSKQASSV